MEWWQWIVFGCLVLGAELLVDAQFYLVFVGLSAIAVGLNDLAPFAPPPWGQWLLFSAVSVVSIVAFRKRLYTRLRVGTADLAEGVDGEVGVAREPIDPNRIGSVELRGARWSARNGSTAAIAAGDRVRVTASEGLTVIVVPESD